MTEIKRTTATAGYELPKINASSGLLTAEQIKAFCERTWPKLKETVRRPLYRDLCEVLGTDDAKAAEAKHPKLVSALRYTRGDLPETYKGSVRNGFSVEDVYELAFATVNVSATHGVFGPTSFTDDDKTDPNYGKTVADTMRPLVQEWSKVKEQIGGVDDGAAAAITTVATPFRDWMTTEVKSLRKLADAVKVVTAQTEDPATLKAVEGTLLTKMLATLAEAEAKDAEAQRVRRWLVYQMCGDAFKCLPKPTLPAAAPAPAMKPAAALVPWTAVDVRRLQTALFGTFEPHATMPMVFDGSSGRRLAVEAVGGDPLGWTLYSTDRKEDRRGRGLAELEAAMALAAHDTVTITSVATLLKLRFGDAKVTVGDRGIRVNEESFTIDVDLAQHSRTTDWRLMCGDKVKFHITKELSGQGLASLADAIA